MGVSAEMDIQSLHLTSSKIFFFHITSKQLTSQDHLRDKTPPLGDMPAKSAQEESSQTRMAVMIAYLPGFGLPNTPWLYSL